jgi:adenylate cyclase, class 2
MRHQVTGSIETEIKIPFPAAPADAVRLIEQRGYRMVSPRTLQSDQVFDRPDRALRRAGELLRLRSDGGQWILTYKGAALAARHKSREEIETSFSSGEELARILERLGFTPCFRYQKYRTGFRAMGESGTIFLDETPIGVFLELEGAEDWIDGTAIHLGFAEKDYVGLSYASLYEKYLQHHDAGPDMLFRNPL